MRRGGKSYKKDGRSHAGIKGKAKESQRIEPFRHNREGEGSPKKKGNCATVLPPSTGEERGGGGGGGMTEWRNSVNHTLRPGATGRGASGITDFVSRVTIRNPLCKKKKGKLEGGVN